jgi:hypothetical protein
MPNIFIFSVDVPSFLLLLLLCFFILCSAGDQIQAKQALYWDTISSFFHFSFHFQYFLLLCWVGVHCSIYKSSYNISNISYLKSAPSPFSFIPSLHFWNSFNRYHFSCTYMCTQYLHYIHPPTPYLHLLPPSLPLVPIPQTRSVLPSCSPIL